MSIKDKSESIAVRMNKLTTKFTENMDTADEMVVTGADIVDLVSEKTQDIELYTELSPDSPDIVNLENLVKDFKYVRETLKENTDNGRRVLNSVTYDLLDSDDDKRASLIMSFAELNKAIADNMKLYILGYKEISNVILNLDKIAQNKINQSKVASPQQTVTNNNLTINSEPISTADLIKSLSGSS